MPVKSLVCIHSFIRLTDRERKGRRESLYAVSLSPPAPVGHQGWDWPGLKQYAWRSPTSLTSSSILSTVPSSAAFPAYEHGAAGTQTQQMYAGCQHKLPLTPLHHNLVPQLSLILYYVKCSYDFRTQGSLAFWIFQLTQSNLVFHNWEEIKRLVHDVH